MEELLEQWAKIERLPTFERARVCLFDEYHHSDDENGEASGKRAIDVRRLGALDRRRFVEKLIKQIEADNLQLLHKIRNRMNRVGIKSPSVEVRYEKLCVEAKCKVVDGKPLPTLWKSLKSLLLVITKLVGCQEANICIVQDVSGILKPGRLTLLLGPPGCGKTSLLMALSGTLNKSLKVSGDVTYNGYKLNEFVPQKTCAYVSQYDLHIPEITVRETLDFSARCQGVGKRSEIMIELCRKEKISGIVPDPDIDAYMKAIAAEGLESTLLTDYVLKILGLDVCADTTIGDAMRSGISGGQKKRLTTGEMIVGPTKALFMDEITNGLDSSTAFQIVSCIQQLAHMTDATTLVALLQPAPEIFDLFDDIVLMAEGKIVYHGPRSSVLDLFEECGFRCPQRKGVADFLQEVISRKDQWQYWFLDNQPYKYVSVDMFLEKFKASPVGRKLYEQVSQPHVKSQSDETAISFSPYSLSMWELFKACLCREYLLTKRNSFFYVLRVTQMIIVAFISMTVFLRTRLGVDVVHSNYYLGALFYGLIVFLADGLAEAGLMIMRLPVFFKQRDLYLYPAWAYVVPASLLMIPFSAINSLVWTSLTYYVTGYSPEIGRFFCQFLLLSLVHFTSISFYRFLAALFQTSVAAMSACSFFLSFTFIFAGFVIPQPSMPSWLKWVFWADPLSYGEIGLSVNEFLAPRWQKMMVLPNTTVGDWVLESRGLDFAGYYYWISVGALIGFALLANIGFTLALTFLKAPGISDAIISREKLAQLQDPIDNARASEQNKTCLATKGKMILPFRPLTIAFRDLSYCVDTSGGSQKHGVGEKKLQMLTDITGAFRPGVLTALMGATGAGKTTLLDVLAGRKTSGYITGDIRISGFPKVQETFARVSGYCEQADIHSPQITVEESIVFSAWLRLPDSIDSETRKEFVNQVLETIELDEIRDALVGVPGASGLSTEQRKRLTIAVELVSNPSIIFMDEPTTGLDARAAAIVMRAVKNVAATGRTVVCTIHQPSIHIFEAFDELILLKTGGRIIYSGPLGQHSHKVIDYFEGISGVPKIRDNYNPATWMLEVTLGSAEAQLGVDFAQVYLNSVVYKNTEEVVKQLSSPASGSEDVHFGSRFSKNGWEQYKSCLWKLHLSYWRSPSYNLTRLVRNLVSSLVLGLLFWQKGTDLKNQQSLLTVFGSMMAPVLFLGVNNCSNVLPIVATEREVVYRERFAGMYSSWAYSFAQVTVELPYLLIEAVMFTMITYPMIGYYPSAYKVCWYCFAMFCNLMSYNFLGMMLVSVTPNFQVAAIVSPAFYALFSLFAGFYIPAPRIPKWWIWLHYVCPPAWALRAMLTSQYGDVQSSTAVFGQTNTVSGFLKDYFDFESNQLPLVAAVLVSFPLVFASLFAIFMEKLNFQRR